MLDRQIQLYSIDTSFLFTDIEKNIWQKMQLLYYERKDIQKNKQKLDDINQRLKNIQHQISRHKNLLLRRISENESMRKFDDTNISVKNKVSMFESSLSRTLGIKTDEFTKDLLLVEVYYLGVLKDIIRDGFEWNGEKYVFYCASAGQIRKKLNIFIKESTFEKHYNTLMCGLSREKINETGLNTGRQS